MKVVPLGNGVFRLDEDTRSRLAYAVGPADARWVFLDGSAYLVDVTGGSQAVSRRRRASAAEAALAAPMPATVVAVNVEPGQRVSTGDVMILLEAMKMELPVRAPRDGTVRAVACRAGELVQPGVPLLEIE
jgi:3-methylcrotonyl-CoA carboxylase alpha subunit